MTMPDEDDEDLEPGDYLDPEQRDPEAPPEDALEQATPAEPSLREPPPRIGLEVPEWDALEQARAVPIDDDYE
jgi:hypothetical protein